MYLGGSVRTLGIVIHEDVPAALRFADMAQEYFWKYRVRGANPPADRDLNYDRKQLEQDMAHEAHALALLKEMEEYFLTEGILKSSKERHAEELTKRAQRLNVRTEIKLNHTEIIESLGGLHETCESLVKRLKAIEDQNRILVDIVKTLVSVHTQAVAVPYVPPGYTEVTTNPMITS